MTRTRVLARVTIVINVIMFALVYAYLGKIIAVTDNAFVGVSILGVRIILLGTAGLYLAASRISDNGDVPKRVLDFGSIFIATLLSSLALHSGLFQTIRPLIAPYLIGVITVAAYIYLTGLHCFLLFGWAWLIMAASLAIFQPDGPLLVSHLLHITAMTVAAVAISRVIYASKVKEVIYQIRIERQNRELEILSLTDKLTGLANRRLMDKHLAEEWRRCSRQGLSLSLIMLDIDHFKRFNDTYGHGRGDECLESIARALREKANRAGDLTARYGGEEFAVILSDADQAGALSLAQAFRENIEALAIPNVNTDLGIVTVSIGCATVSPDAFLSPKALLEKADTALYKAKANGRNRIEV